MYYYAAPLLLSYGRRIWPEVNSHIVISAPVEDVVMAAQYQAAG